MPVPAPCIEDSDSISLAMDGANLQASLILSEQPGNGLQILDDGAFVAGFQVVTSLPVGPSDGDRVILHATLGDTEASGNAWAWPLQFVASIGAAGSWIPLSGAPFVDFRGGTGTLASGGGGAWGTLAGTDVAGPLITLPAAGDWVIRWGGNVTSPTNGQNTRIGLGINGADPTTPNRISTANANNSEIAGTRLLTGRAAGDIIQCLYNTDAVGTASFTRRWLEAHPARLLSPTS